MDLPKAFDCIRHGFFVNERYDYGLSIDAITFLCLYLKMKKQGFKYSFNIISTFIALHKFSKTSKLC